MNCARVLGFPRRIHNLAACVMFLFCGSASKANEIIVDFEDLTEAEAPVFTASSDNGSYFNGNSLGASNSDGWSSGGVYFGNSYSADFGGFWSGWSYSTIKDSENGDFTNQYAAVTGAGHDSETYAVGFAGDSLFFNVPDGTRPDAVRLTNTTYAAATIFDGNMFSKPFGGPKDDDGNIGPEEDFFSVVFTGMTEPNGLGIPTGEQEFFLADYRGDEKLIINTWEQIDLTNLGSAKSVKLSFTSSDVHEEFGINTPQYVAIDNLTFAPDSLLGDLDGNGVLDAVDMHLLSVAVRNGDASSVFDLNADGGVNQGDRTFWVHELKNTYFGDANLDGEFNTDDFTSIFQFAQYEDAIEGNSTWERGDWDGNGDFETGDLVRAFQDGGFELGPRLDPRTAMVPEPFGVPIVALAWLGFAFRRTRESR